MVGTSATSIERRDGADGPNAAKKAFHRASQPAPIARLLSTMDRGEGSSARLPGPAPALAPEPDWLSSAFLRSRAASACAAAKSVPPTPNPALAQSHPGSIGPSPRGVAPLLAAARAALPPARRVPPCCGGAAASLPLASAARAASRATSRRMPVAAWRDRAIASTAAASACWDGRAECRWERGCSSVLLSSRPTDGCGLDRDGKESGGEPATLPQLAASRGVKRPGLPAEARLPRAADSRGSGGEPGDAFPAAARNVRLPLRVAALAAAGAAPADAPLATPGPSARGWFEGSAGRLLGACPDRGLAGFETESFQLAPQRAAMDRSAASIAPAALSRASSRKAEGRPWASPGAGCGAARAGSAGGGAHSSPRLGNGGASLAGTAARGGALGQEGPGARAARAAASTAAIPSRNTASDTGSAALRRLAGVCRLGRSRARPGAPVAVPGASDRPGEGVAGGA